MKIFKMSIHFVFLLFWFFIAPSGALAIYDPRTLPNNKAGVHILNPSEIGEAAKLVNSSGGDWGYVTVPIQPTDRDKDKWQTFMREAKELHVIPIVRITTIPQGGTWTRGHDTDLVDFANFLGELDWPIENRYIVLFNEVNRANEWGGTVEPEKYASIVKNAYSIFKERSPDFFLLGPALDNSLPNSSTSLSAQTYMNRMSVADPRVWTYFDGWASHSYPNPGFTANPQQTGPVSVVSYKSDFAKVKIATKPTFITETGWDQTKLDATLIQKYWNSVWKTWQIDGNVVAVTPFVLQGGDQFAQFSLKNEHGYTASGEAIYSLGKVAGSPKTVTTKPLKAIGSAAQQPSWIMPFFKSSKSLLKLENIFRVILGLPTKSTVTLKDLSLAVELAQTPKQWEHGLSDRDGLDNSDGMLFIFPQYHVPVFWMKDMRFPIDIIWISGNKVVDITPSAPVETSDTLPTYSPHSAVNMVLETAAGWAKDHDIAIGDTLVIEN